MQSSVRCLAFRKLLLTKSVWSMISLLLILPHLVQLCLSHLLIMLILRIMNVKLKQLMKTQTKVNLFQEHTLRLKRKRLETLGLRRLTTKSLNRRSRISVITVELQGILVQIATSGQPLNKAIICSRLDIRISFHPLLLLLENFSRLSCSFRTLMVSILPPHLRIKGLHKGKVLLKCGRKKAQSDLVTFSLSLLLVMHFLFVLLFFLSQSSFILCVFLYVFVWLFFSFFLFCFS